MCLDKWPYQSIILLKNIFLKKSLNSLTMEEIKSFKFNVQWLLDKMIDVHAVDELDYDPILST